MSKPRKTRLDLHTTPEVLAILKRAAEIEGRSLTDFVVAAASAAARQTLEQTEIIRLSGEDARCLWNIYLIRRQSPRRWCGRLSITSGWLGRFKCGDANGEWKGPFS